MAFSGIFTLVNANIPLCFAGMLNMNYLSLLVMAYYCMLLLFFLLILQNDRHMNTLMFNFALVHFAWFQMYIVHIGINHTCDSVGPYWETLCSSIVFWTLGMLPHT